MTSLGPLWAGVVMVWLSATWAEAQTTNVPMGSVWRYDNRGFDLGQSWRSNTFVASWPSGPGPLGYGQGGEATIIVGDPDLVTIYFRHEFILPDPPGISALTLQLICDDGAAVYLNGAEVYRRNLPAGPLGYRTLATSAVEGDAARKVHQYAVSPYLARAGTNLIAVELHQHTLGVEDARFDLALIANLPLTLPEVRIISPTNLQVLPPGTVRFQAETDDLDGFVYLVRYYVNGVQVGESDQEPTFDFDWPSGPSGRYRLVAEAIDNSGRRRESSPVHFQVGDVTGTEVTRGPYLQSGSSTGLVVRWRTDWPSGSVVRYGTSPFDLDFAAAGAPGIDHEVRLSGLQPETTYYYEVQSEAGAVSGGFGPDFAFTTGSDRTRPVRIWAIGDSGRANAAAAAVRDAYAGVTDRTDVWLMLGDNAYDEGTDTQYQQAVFDMYPALLRNTVLWPTLGNHDAASAGEIEEYPYFDIFTLPRHGEAGGLASGTERYYSFDQANIHFVCLDSQSSDRKPGSPMLAWLENDLAATSKDWIVAFWHHPPYSWGTHNSDVEIELIEMRTHAGPLLERYGVDLVLCGHSHVYERSHLLNGHPGHSSTLTPEMILDAGGGGPFAGGPYRKPSGGIGANQGTVYAVCGCSGEGGSFPFPRHPAMAVNLSGYGSVFIDVSGLFMDVFFLTDGGGFADWFRIDKSGPGPIVSPRLEIQKIGFGVELRWPTSEMDFQLESRPTIDATAPWESVPGVAPIIGRSHRLWQGAAGTNRIFRLRSTP